MLHEGAKIRYSNIEALAPMNVIILEKDVAKVWDNYHQRIKIKWQKQRIFVCRIPLFH